MDIYQKLNVKTYINAWDAASEFGSSRMEKETFDAMRAAAVEYVNIQELQAAVGREIASMTGNEAAYVVSGAAAGMLMASAVCMVRHPEPDLFAMLPNASQLRNEFILLREETTSVGYAIKAAGGKVIDVGFGTQIALADVERAITSKTCAIVYCDSQVMSVKCPPLRTLTYLAHKHDVYMVVQASGQVPPKENLWNYTVENGADLAVFAGGKAIRGAQQSGLLLGRRALMDLIKMVAPPMRGVAHATKEGREEIISVYAALKKLLQPGVMEERLRRMRNMRQRIALALDETGYFKTVELYPGPTGQGYRWMGVEVLGNVCATNLRRDLMEHEPGVLVGTWEWHNGITINTLNMEENEVQPVIDAVIACYEKQQGEGVDA